MPNDALISSDPVGSVAGMETTPAPTDRLITYADMERMTGGRIKGRSFASYQSESRARERAGRARRMEMPPPAQKIMKTSKHAQARRWRKELLGLSHIPVYSYRAWREWMEGTDRGHLIVPDSS